MTKELGVFVLLSEFTAQAVQGQVALEAIGRVEVRGKHEPVEVFKLANADSKGF